jgi:hypothetical protein
VIDSQAVLLALRTRLLTLSVVTTGSANLAASTAGYTRASGSFLTDGFAAGMEVTPSGFTQTATGVVSAVATGTLTITGGRTVQTAGAGRSVACLLPAARAWENVAFQPITGSPWVEEDYLPGPVAQTTLGPRGRIEALSLYVLKLYGLPQVGAGALFKMADAVLLLFAPRTALTLSSGDVVRVRTDPAPYRGQLMQDTAGFAVVTVTVPLRVETANTI